MSTVMLETEEKRVAERLSHLKALVRGLELTLADRSPPGPYAAQQVAHAAVDLAAFVSRLDLARRVAKGVSVASKVNTDRPCQKCCEHRSTVPNSENSNLNDCLTCGLRGIVPPGW
jgi:hypothetical protein